MATLMAVESRGIPHLEVTQLRPREVSCDPHCVGAPAKGLLSLGQ